MNTSTMLIIAFLCLAIGYIAGLLVSSLSGNRAKNETVKPEVEAAPSISSTLPPISVISATPEPKNDPLHELTPFDQALIWREQPGGPLQVDLDGKSYSKAASLTPGQRQRLTAWIPDLQTWLGVPLPGTNARAGKREEALGSNLSELRRGEVRPEASPKTALPPAQKSIVSQIDEILQDQIGGTPLAGRGIKLVEAPGQGVTVWIGLEQFQGIDTVTDADVLAAIRRAVNTWEAQSA